MGWIKISIDVNEKGAKVDLASEELTVHDLSVAISQLELTKLNLIAQLSKKNI